MQWRSGKRSTKIVSSSPPGFPRPGISFCGFNEVTVVRFPARARYYHSFSPYYASLLQQYHRILQYVRNTHRFRKSESGKFSRIIRSAASYRPSGSPLQTMSFERISRFQALSEDTAHTMPRMLITSVIANRTWMCRIEPNCHIFHTSRVYKSLQMQGSSLLTQLLPKVFSIVKTIPSHRNKSHTVQGPVAEWWIGNTP
jgi:hypothetical protein